MPNAFDRSASRHGRDRDLLPTGPRVGPYELPYDVRRGYQESFRPGRQARPASGVLLFRAREEEEDRGEG
jgi:hypothetical protein